VGCLRSVQLRSVLAEQVGCVTTEWKLVGANHRVCVESFPDPKVPGVTCHVSQAKTGGVSGSFGSGAGPFAVLAGV
jgi:CreA protein